MKLDLFKKIFYPLNYLSMPSVGLDISNRAIRFTEFSNERGRISIKNIGEVALAPNIIKDGDILNKDALIKALVEAKGKISSDMVSVSIPEEKTYIFEVKIPKVDDSEIRQALEFRLEENVPLKADEVFFEYEIIGNPKKTDPMLFLSVSVIPKSVIENYLAILSSAGLYPVTFEIESKMVARSVIQKKYNKTSMIVYIKDDSTIFSLVVDTIVRFTTVIPVGESTIKANLLKVNPTQKDNTDSFYTQLNTFSIIKDEVEKFIDYVKSEKKNKKNIESYDIDRIILCGESTTLPGFLNHISQNLNIEIVRANVWSNVFNPNEYLPAITFDDSLSFATSIGLAVPYLKYKK